MLAYEDPIEPHGRWVIARTECEQLRFIITISINYCNEPSIRMD
jgi:hypothetical protein